MFCVETDDGNMIADRQAASEYPASFVVAITSAIKRQMISDGAIRVGELPFSGPVPNGGDFTCRASGNIGN